jgi:hypothetical protein
LAETFPASGWRTVASGSVGIATARTVGSAEPRTIPGFYAVVRPGPNVDPNGRRRPMSEKRCEAPS